MRLEPVLVLTPTQETVLKDCLKRTGGPVLRQSRKTSSVSRAFSLASLSACRFGPQCSFANSVKASSGRLRVMYEGCVLAKSSNLFLSERVRHSGE